MALTEDTLTHLRTLLDDYDEHGVSLDRCEWFAEAVRAVLNEVDTPAAPAVPPVIRGHMGPTPEPQDATVVSLGPEHTVSADDLRPQPK